MAYCVTAHLPPFVAKHGRGMAYFCEQVGEAADYSMAPVLQQHKVPEDNYRHRQRLLTTVVKFAS